MEIIETSVFTRLVIEALSDEEYREFQSALAANPELGNKIPGTGGLRKVRWKSENKGKRGSLRIIYYWFITDQEILLLYLYAKNEQEDLTPEQKKKLRQIIERELK